MPGSRVSVPLQPGGVSPFKSGSPYHFVSQPIPLFPRRAHHPGMPPNFLDALNRPCHFHDRGCSQKRRPIGFPLWLFCPSHTLHLFFFYTAAVVTTITSVPTFKLEFFRDPQKLHVETSANQTLIANNVGLKVKPIECHFLGFLVIYIRYYTAVQPKCSPFSEASWARVPRDSWVNWLIFCWRNCFLCLPKTCQNWDTTCCGWTCIYLNSSLLMLKTLLRACLQVKLIKCQ